MKRGGITIAAVATLAVSLTASALVVHRLDRRVADASPDDVLSLPSSKVLRHVSLGYNTLAAELYWTRAVQYFGSKHHSHSSRYELLYPLLDITTDLDPKLLVAYQFGSIFLAQSPPEGAGQPLQAVELVEKGIRRNPENWQLHYNLGWILASELKDYQAAYQVFQRGAQMPGASPAMGVLAAAMAQHGGDIATARLLWTQIYETTENTAIRANAIKRLKALRVDADVPLLEQALAEFRQATGRLPRDWAEIRATGWRGPTVDPVGHPYRILPDGRVEVADPEQLPFITRGLPPGWKPPASEASPLPPDGGPGATPQP
jgi:tetratricopeptide (TPR) repeat protein